MPVSDWHAMCSLSQTTVREMQMRMDYVEDWTGLLAVNRSELFVRRYRSKIKTLANLIARTA